MALFKGSMSAAETGTTVELRVEGFDKPLRARFVGPGKEGGFDLQLALNNEHLSYMRTMLNAMRSKGKRAAA